MLSSGGGEGGEGLFSLSGLPVGVWSHFGEYMGNINETCFSFLLFWGEVTRKG